MFQVIFSVDFDWFYAPVYGVVVFLAAFAGSVLRTRWEDRRARKRENQKLKEKFAEKSFSSGSG